MLGSPALDGVEGLAQLSRAGLAHGIPARVNGRVHARYLRSRGGVDPTSYQLVGLVK
ncbi:MAG: hypothetical protein ACRYFV_15745 [Janthinobacterium lividum]